MSEDAVRKWTPVLTIAGSDNSGGAGIQADLRTFQDFGCYGLSVITAITAQNSHDFITYEPVSPRMVSLQIEACLGEHRPLSLKTGMLATVENIHAVSQAMIRYKLEKLVIDPVLKASTGDSLAAENLLNAFRDILIPRAFIITPNRMEAELLSGMKIASRDDVFKAAKIIQTMGVDNVIIKGGHLDFDEEESVDTLFTLDFRKEYRAEKIPNLSFHGSGCIFSAALCACLGSGFDLEKSVDSAKRYVWRAMRNSQKKS